jgi:hypothetical protein
LCIERRICGDTTDSISFQHSICADREPGDMARLDDDRSAMQLAEQREESLRHPCLKYEGWRQL